MSKKKDEEDNEEEFINPASLKANELCGAPSSVDAIRIDPSTGSVIPSWREQTSVVGGYSTGIDHTSDHLTYPWQSEMNDPSRIIGGVEDGTSVLAVLEDYKSTKVFPTNASIHLIQDDHLAGVSRAGIASVLSSPLDSSPFTPREDFPSTSSGITKLLEEENFTQGQEEQVKELVNELVEERDEEWKKGHKVENEATKKRIEDMEERIKQGEQKQVRHEIQELRDRFSEAIYSPLFYDSSVDMSSWRRFFNRSKELKVFCPRHRKGCVKTLKSLEEFKATLTKQSMEDPLECSRCKAEGGYARLFLFVTPDEVFTIDHFRLNGKQAEDRVDHDG